MRNWLLAAKIAGVFLLVMWSLVISTLFLFAHLMRSGDPGAAHDEFMGTVLAIGFVAMLGIIGLSVYVTAPLRRMSRSMDRIAAGDLEHRVHARGFDEAAAIGRSFNTMAERIRSMIVGQKELMAGVSHELRSPLTRMKVSLELLREGRGGPERITDLEADVDALDALVGELLLASRIDLGAAFVELEVLDLQDLIRGAWERGAAEARDQGSTLELRCADDARRVDANRPLVVRLLGNLLENSVRYASPGVITVSAVRRGDRVRVSVADEGPAVDPADLERLFEPFFRADRSRSRKTGGEGLGLMIVRRAVEAHGGSVRAGRGDPQGLVVTFDLPASRD